ncbi:MAG: heavy-metal-associated domain-containing protein [Bacteroidales bacterium]
MSTLKFKTNLKCAGCMYAIKPFMEELKGVEKWDVDLNDSDKTVNVKTSSTSAEEIIEAIQRAGYKAKLK